MPLPTAEMIQIYSNTTEPASTLIRSGIKMHQDWKEGLSPSLIPDHTYSTLSDQLPHLLLPFTIASIDVWKNTVDVKTAADTAIRQTLNQSAIVLKVAFASMSANAITLLHKLFDLFLPATLAILVCLSIFTIIKGCLELGVSIGYALRSALCQAFRQIRSIENKPQDGGQSNNNDDNDLCTDTHQSSNSTLMAHQYLFMKAHEDWQSQSATHQDPPRWTRSLKKDKKERHLVTGNGQYRTLGREEEHKQQDTEGKEKEEKDGDDLSLWQDWIFAFRWGVLPLWSVWPKDAVEVFEEEVEEQKRVVRQGLMSGDLVQYELWVATWDCGLIWRSLMVQTSAPVSISKSSKENCDWTRFVTGHTLYNAFDDSV